MTGMSGAAEKGAAAERPAGTGSRPGTAAGGRRRPGWREITSPIWLLERAQDLVTIAVGIVLVALAGVQLVTAIAGFLNGSDGPVSAAAPAVVDRVLLVLILVEIVHTVVLSLRTHRLEAQPFIVVGLVAVIRRILLALSPGTQVKLSTTQLALLVAMVAVFVAALIAVTRLMPRED